MCGWTGGWMEAKRKKKFLTEPMCFCKIVLHWSPNVPATGSSSLWIVLPQMCTDRTESWVAIDHGGPQRSYSTLCNYMSDTISCWKVGLTPCPKKHERNNLCPCAFIDTCLPQKQSSAQRWNSHASSSTEENIFWLATFVAFKTTHSRFPCLCSRKAI